MHCWGDEGVDWEGINDAAYFIAHWLKTWVRMPVYDYKEKWGTVRLSCGFGWHGIYPIWRPMHHWYPKWWPMRLDFWLADTWLWSQVNRLAVKVHQKAYVWRYRKAVERWPHLYKEIVTQADFGELFEGVRFAGQRKAYKHSDYWTVVK